jgi:hypothetical protein
MTRFLGLIVTFHFWNVSSISRLTRGAVSAQNPGEIERKRGKNMATAMKASGSKGGG